jgi:hypothetical protein
MTTIEIFDNLPFWGVFLLTVAVILVAIEVGFRLGRRARERPSKLGKIQIGSVVAASLGLLGFILAFTYSSVISHYDLRKQLVLDEANAVGTTYLRADVLTDVDRAAVYRILDDYVTLRIEVVQGDNRDQFEDFLKRSEELLDGLWFVAVTIAEQHPTPPISALFMQSVNQVVDLHQARVTVGNDHRMPAIFWFALYGLTVIAMVVGGYDSGLNGGRRSFTALISLTLAFSVILALVVALDRPFGPISGVSQAAMVDIQQKIRRSTQSL